MNVLFLAEARAKQRSPRSNQWTSNEIAELTRLYRAKSERDGAVCFAVGTTDFDDPQFYVLTDGGDQSCSVCVSRLTRDGRSWYVIEDGNGRIEDEGGCLRTLVARISKQPLTGWRALVPVLAYCAQQFFGAGFDPQDVASAAECLMVIA